MTILFTKVVTMSDMKCPFCQQELESVLQLVGAGGLVEEAYLLCSKCNTRGERKLWEELIRTRKALAFAKSKLNGIHRLYSKAFYTREDWLQVCMEMVDKANTALEQITTLEQKDVK